MSADLDQTRLERREAAQQCIGCDQPTVAALLVEEEKAAAVPRMPGTPVAAPGSAAATPRAGAPRPGNSVSVVKVRLYSVTVTYQDGHGRSHEEIFPVRAYDHAMATRMALDYVLHVLKIKEFELRVVGS